MAEASVRASHFFAFVFVVVVVVVVEADQGPRFNSLPSHLPHAAARGPNLSFCQPAQHCLTTTTSRPATPHKRKAKAGASRLSHLPHTMPPRRSRQAATQASSPVPIQTQRRRRDDTPKEDEDIDIEDAIREAQGSGSVKQLGRCKDRRGPRPRPRPHPNPWLTTAPRQMPATPRKRKAKATADEEGNDAEVTPKRAATPRKRKAKTDEGRGHCR